MDYNIEFLKKYLTVPAEYRTSIEQGDFIKTSDGRVVIFHSQDEEGLYKTFLPGQDRIFTSEVNSGFLTSVGTIARPSQQEIDQLTKEVVTELEKTRSEQIIAIREKINSIIISIEVKYRMLNGLAESLSKLQKPIEVIDKAKEEFKEIIDLAKGEVKHAKEKMGSDDINQLTELNDKLNNIKKKMEEKQDQYFVIMGTPNPPSK